MSKNRSARIENIRMKFYVNENSTNNFIWLIFVNLQVYVRTFLFYFIRIKRQLIKNVTYRFIRDFFF